MYVYIYICDLTPMHIYTGICTYVLTYIYVCVYMCIHIYVFTNTYVCIYIYIYIYIYIQDFHTLCVCVCIHALEYVCMGWLRLVGFLKVKVFFAKEPHKRDDILQKRPIILRSLLIIATPYASILFDIYKCMLWFKLFIIFVCVYSFMHAYTQKKFLLHMYKWRNTYT